MSWSNMAVASKAKQPIVFDEFFELGLPETASPFLTPRSRIWGAHLHLRASLLATFCLIASFILYLFTPLTSLSYLLLVLVYFFAGIPSLIASVQDLSKLEINIDVLMTLAAFLSILIGSPMEGGLLLVLFALSGSMEDVVTAKAKGAISSLYKLSPTKAWVMKDNGELIERAVKDIPVGNKIVVKPGETIPLDGVVLKGVSALNLVHLTGENLPLTKREGDEVPAGARNIEGALVLEVMRTSSDSTLAQIIQLVTQAQESRPRLQRWFDQMSKGYATTVILLTAFFSLSLPWILQIPFLGVEGSLYRSIAFLIAASPCALIIATPIAYLSALGVCARNGILLKGGVTLDALAKCSMIAFDKTGTLTTGQLQCTSFISLHSENEQKKQALAVAAALEQYAVHPIAKAILSYAEKEKVSSIELQEFRSIPGYGVEAVAILPKGNKTAFLGNPEYILPKLAPEPARLLEKRMEAIKQEGNVMAVLLLGQEVYLFHFEDTIRTNIHETLQELKKRWQLVMLTGDHFASAQKIANKLGIQQFHADLRPDDKLRLISQMEQEKGIVMVGDGINDAPALARATVGIAMGKVGSATAVQAADVVLLQDNLELLVWLMDKASQTKRIVKQNLTLAFSVIFLATTPALLGWIPLWLAVVLHEGGTVLVGLNALRLIESKHLT